MSGGPDDGAPVPQDPISAMREGALALRAIWEQWVAAGFTPWQACVIMGTMLAQAQPPAPEA